MNKSETEKALDAVMDAASELATRATAFAQLEPAAVPIAALCSGVAGIILDPGGWGQTAIPAAAGVVDAVARRLPEAEAELKRSIN